MSEKALKKNIRFTKFGGWLFFLACFLLLSAQNTGNNLLYLVSSSIFTAIVFSLIDIIISIIGFEAELVHPQIALEGQNVNIICKISKNKYIDRFFIRFEDSWIEKIEKGFDGFLKKEVVLDKIGQYEFQDLSIIKPSMLDIFYFQYVFQDFTINVIDDYNNSEKEIFIKKSNSDKKIKNLGREGDFYGLEQYQEGDDASRINWTISSRSQEEWVIIREKSDEEINKIINTDDDLKRKSLPLEHYIIKGKSYNELASLCLNKSLDKSVFRLIILISLLTSFGIYTIGFLQYLIPIIACLFIIFGLKGSAIDKKYHKYFYYGSLIVGIYILFKVLSIKTTSKIELLLEFSLLILVLQSMTMSIVRNVLGAITLVFMIILGISTIEVNSSFPLLFLPFLIFASMILTFFRINLVSTDADAKSQYSVSPKGIMGTVFLLITFAIFWIPLFYLIPRNNYGLASNLSDNNQKGFSSKTLSLNDSGFLEDNQAVVMRIIPSDEKSNTPQALKIMGRKLIRGGSFNLYENGEWKKQRRGLYMKRLNRDSRDLVLDRDFKDFNSLYNFDIILENSDNPIVFFPEQTKKIKFQNYNVGMEIDGSLFFPDRKSIYNKKYVVSIPSKNIEIKNSRIDELLSYTFDYRNYKYISQTGITDKTLQLANSFAIKDFTINGRVEMVMNYLKENCSYTLDQPPIKNGVDPVDDFLFGNKVGNCQHYATAMALLLRAMRIPTRVVNGYIMGDWNDTGGFFTVRESNAHAWVEVFYPRSGWVAFDPTPPEEKTDSTLLEEYWDRFTDLYEGYWFNYIYNFDHNTQNKYIKTVFEKLIKIIGLLLFSPIFWGIIIVSFIIFKLLKKYIIGIYRYIRKSNWLPISYTIWESGIKIPRLSNETPIEYHNRLLANQIINEENRATLKLVEELIDEYAFKKDSNKSLLSAKISKLLMKIDTEK